LDFAIPHFAISFYTRSIGTQIAIPKSEIRNPHSEFRNPNSEIRNAFYRPAFGGLVAVISTVCYHFSQLSISERERSDTDFNCELCALSLEVGRRAPVQ